MAKAKDTRAPVKLPPDLHEKLKRAQNTEWEETGSQPSFGDLLARSWELYSGPKAGSTRQKVPVGLEAKSQRETYPYSESNRILHDKLETVLNSGDDMTIRAVVPNIEIFFERLKPANARRKSGTG